MPLHKVINENLIVILVHEGPIIWKHLEREIIPLKVGSTLYAKWSSAFLCRIIIDYFQAFNPKQLDPKFTTFKYDILAYLLADFSSKKWSTSYEKWSLMKKSYGKESAPMSWRVIRHINAIRLLIPSKLVLSFEMAFL